MGNLIQTKQWQMLEQHYQKIKTAKLTDLFASHPDRFKQYSLGHGNIFLDYSKNIITDETIQLLCHLASSSGLSHKIEQLFSGGCVNTTERSPALHTALRDKTHQEVWYKGKNVADYVTHNLDKMAQVSQALRQKQWLGYTGKSISDIVNIGIGGSSIGVKMAFDALKPFTTKDLRFHFVSNIERDHIEEILEDLNPETTLLIVCSKSFTTMETLMNARIAQQWLNISTRSNNQILAVTANKQVALDFGINEKNIFEMLDCIGGRYSLWSAMGLSLAIAIGINHFKEMLDGAYDMDCHFRYAPFRYNMPILLALLGIWYHNFFGASTHAIIPYGHYIKGFPIHVQQLDMESNGKCISNDGKKVSYRTGPIVWGNVGTDSQHTFHQLLHQGQHFVTIDFIATIKSLNPHTDHHQFLLASCLSQSEVLMEGNSQETIIAKLRDEGLTQAEAEYLAMHKHVPGNKPSNVILLHQLTPKVLGSLVALYEHKIFTQGTIWDINAYDQYGVEAGKQLSAKLLKILQHGSSERVNNSSTKGLIRYLDKILHKDRVE